MLIGIHGKKGAGKDTAAMMMLEMLVAEGKRDATITHYADRLKASLANLLNADIRAFHDPKLKEEPLPNWDFTPRQAMTMYHDAMVPKYGEDIFVKPVQRMWEELKEFPATLIIADVRYEGRETDWIREAGGVIIHIRRTEADKAEATHSSEQGISVGQNDVIVYNNDTKVELEETMRDVLKYRLKLI